MSDLACTHCGKRLSRKSARQIDGVIMCSTCMFKPASRRDSDGSGEADKTGTGLAVGDSADPKGIAPQVSDNEL